MYSFAPLVRPFVRRLVALIPLGLAPVGSLMAQGPVYTAYHFTTLAGAAAEGGSDGTGAAAQFKGPAGAAVDGSGNIYIADAQNNTIRKITPESGIWIVTTLAGTAGVSGHADGTGAAALFSTPNGVAVDGSGNVYVADSRNDTIREITVGGVVTTLAGTAGSQGSADGTGAAAQFFFPTGVAVDGAGNLYVADSGNNTIRKIAPGGVVTTLAGTAPVAGGSGSNGAGSANGTGLAAQFNQPVSVVVDGSDNVYVADKSNSMIRKITAGGVVTTLAGSPLMPGSADGTGAAARFGGPSGVSLDSSGNLYVADTSNSTIREITPGGVVTTLAGTAGSPGSADGTGILARFRLPTDVAADPNSGNLYVTDTGNNTIRVITPGGVVSTLAGATSFGSQDGTGAAAQFNGPFGVTVDSSANIYVADTSGDTIRKITAGGVVTTFAGLAGAQGSSDSTDGTGGTARFSFPHGVAADGSGNVYVADTDNDTIREITPAGVVTTLAGTAGSSGSTDASGANARFFLPTGVAVDASGNVYVADSGNDTIREIAPGGAVTTLAGAAGSPGSLDGTGSLALFKTPAHVAVDAGGNVYVVDSGNNTIRKIAPGGVVTTLAGAVGTVGNADGTGTVAQFNVPYGLAVDGSGNVYVADAGNDAIRRITPAGVVTTAAGSDGVQGSADGTGAAALFNQPHGVAVDGNGTLYVADSGNNTIRQGTANNAPVASNGAAALSGGQPVTFTLVATDADGDPITYAISSQTGGTTTLSGNQATFTPTAAGNDSITFTASDGYATSNAATVTIAAAPATVTLSDLEQTFDGNLKQAVATTSPANLTASITYDGSSSEPSAVGSYAVVATVTSPGYIGSASGTLTIDASNQTISFGSIPDQVFGVAPFTVSATASSGLPVTFSVLNGPATLSSGNLLTITGAGSVTLQATQAGDGSFNPANASDTFNVDLAPATVTLGSLNQTYDGTPKSVTVATSPAGLSTNVSYSGGPGAPSAAGSYAITATVSTPGYSGSASGTLTIAAADQTVAFPAISGHTFGDPPFSASATASSGLPVTFLVLSGPASVAGSTVTITGVGSVTLEATQVGNQNYNSGSATQTFAVAQTAATIALGNLNQSADGTAKSVLVTTAPAGLATSVTYNGSATAPSAVGSYAVAAAITDPDYTGSASATLTITTSNQTVAFSAIPGHTFGDAPFTASATASSGLTPVTFSVLSGPAAIAGSTVTLTGAGSVTLQATQAGNGSFSAANASQTFTVAPAAATIALGSLNQTYDGSAKIATATTTPSGLSTSITYRGSATAPSTAGTYAVAATITDPNYTGSSSGTLTIAPAGQTVTFPAISGHLFGDAPFTVSATASSGLPVTFSVVSGPATLSGTTVTITGVGRVVLKATAATSGNYTSASANRAFTVAAAAATVALSNINQSADGTPKSVVVTTVPSGLATSVTYNGSPSPPSVAGSYTVAATITNPDYTGSASGTLTITLANQTVMFSALPSHIFGDAPFTVSATASSGLTPITFSVVSGPATITDSTVTLTGTGGVTLQASQAGNGTFSAANASQTFNVAVAPATIAFGNLNQGYDGSAKSVTVTTNPAGLSTSLTYDGGATAPSAAGSYPVTATITDSNYAGSASGTLTIRSSSQTVMFSPIAGQTFGVAPFGLSATASSGLGITFQVVGGPATVSGSTVTITGAGSVTLQATQAGNANYSAANASQTFTVAAAPLPTITTQPVNQVAALGSGSAPSAVFIVGASGVGPFGYQWRRKAAGTGAWVNLADGGSYSGTATASLTVSGVTGAMDGDHFECVVTNSSGSVVSNAPILTVVSGSSATPPSFTTQPQGQTLNFGSTVVFTVEDPGGVSYQWQLNGADLTDSPEGTTSDVILGSASTKLMITNATGASVGQYTLVATNSAGSTTSDAAALQVITSSAPGLATSISTRAFVGTGDNILIGGFFVVGSTSRTVLVQGIGPALSQFGVTGFLAHPTLSIHQTQNGSDVTLYSNTGWGSSQVLLEAAASVFASPVFQPGSADSELLLTLPPGGYSAEVSGADGGSGVAFCGIYELP